MSYVEPVPVPNRELCNVGLTVPTNAYMLELFGHVVTGGHYSADGSCTAPNAPGFVPRLVTANVGPFRVTGLAPAIGSLTGILGRVRVETPDLYVLLGSAGMQCSRYTKIRQPNGGLKIGPGLSNHSWGTAVDIKINGALDRQGDNMTQRGLLILSSYFNAAGWCWGAAYRTEDAMHFEVSRSLLARWRQSGEL